VALEEPGQAGGAVRAGGCYEHLVGPSKEVRGCFSTAKSRFELVAARFPTKAGTGTATRRCNGGRRPANCRRRNPAGRARLFARGPHAASRSPLFRVCGEGLDFDWSVGRAAGFPRPVERPSNEAGRPPSTNAGTAGAGLAPRVPPRSFSVAKRRAAARKPAFGGHKKRNVRSARCRRRLASKILRSSLARRRPW